MECEKLKKIIIGIGYFRRVILQKYKYNIKIKKVA